MINMFVTLIRSVILYFTVILSLRLMGKRQIGELQPGELVVTIMISECAAAPIQDLDRPALNGIIAIFCLVILEVLLSVATLKLPWARRLLDGSPTLIIKNGVIDQKAMKALRLTIDDISESLRQQGVFDIREVAFALVETGGKLSVKKKSLKDQPTAEMLGFPEAPDKLPVTVVGDGSINKASLKVCGISEQQLEKMIKKKKLKQQEIFLMLFDGDKDTYFVKKQDYGGEKQKS